MSTPAPGGPNQIRQGEADTTAIIIKEVSVEHFAKFLWVFYNPWVQLSYHLLDTNRKNNYVEYMVYITPH